MECTLLAWKKTDQPTYFGGFLYCTMYHCNACIPSSLFGQKSWDDHRKKIRKKLGCSIFVHYLNPYQASWSWAGQEAAPIVEGLESIIIGKCRNQKVSESVRKCQKLLRLESVRIGNCEDPCDISVSNPCKLPVTEIIRGANVPTISNNFHYGQFLTLSNLDSFWHYPILTFFHFPTWAVSNTFQSPQLQHLSVSCSKHW